MRGRPCVPVQDPKDCFLHVRFVDHQPVRQDLEENERERINVRGRPNVAEHAVKLFGCGIAWEQDLHADRALRQVRVRLVDRAANTKVENFRLRFSLGHREEDVARTQREVRDASVVGVGETVRHVLEHTHRLVEGARSWPRSWAIPVRSGPSSSEVTGKRLAFEPLADEVRDRGPGPRRQRAAACQGLRDVEVAPSKLVVKPTALLEILDDRAGKFAIESGRKRQALDGHLRVDRHVAPSIDDAQQSVARERLNAKMLAEDVTD